ncbi:MAG: hypothetical protein ACRDMV_07165 [Streptosporangiales bacterium]
MRTVNAMDRLGVIALVVALLGGGWLMVAPFLVGYQPDGADWTTGTTVGFFVGVGLVGLAFVALVLFAAGALHALASRRADEVPTADEPSVTT